MESTANSCHEILSPQQSYDFSGADQIYDYSTQVIIKDLLLTKIEQHSASVIELLKSTWRAKSSLHGLTLILALSHANFQPSLIGILRNCQAKVIDLSNGLKEPEIYHGQTIDSKCSTQSLSQSVMTFNQDVFFNL